MTASDGTQLPPGFRPSSGTAHPSGGGPDRTDAEPDGPTARDVHRRTVLEAAPEDVWRLLTDPAELGGWWGEGSWLDPVRDGEARFVEEGEPVRSGRVVEVRPGRRLVFDWWPEDPEVDEPASRVSIELVPCPFGTILTITECALLDLADLPVLVAPRPAFLPPTWGPTLGGRARALVPA